MVAAQRVLGLKGARGAEGPAGAAVPLVLDGGHHPLLPPVHPRGGVPGLVVGAGLEGGTWRLGVLGCIVLHDEAVVHGVEFFVCEVSKLVHGEGVAVLVCLLVVVFYQGHVGGPDAEPLHLAQLIFVLLPMLL